MLAIPIEVDSGAIDGSEMQFSMDEFYVHFYIQISGVGG